MSRATPLRETRTRTAVPDGWYPHEEGDRHFLWLDDSPAAVVMRMGGGWVHKGYASIYSTLEEAKAMAIVSVRMT